MEKTRRRSVVKKTFFEGPLGKGRLGAQFTAGIKGKIFRGKGQFKARKGLGKEVIKGGGRPIGGVSRWEKESQQAGGKEAQRGGRKLSSSLGGRRDERGKEGRAHKGSTEKLLGGIGTYEEKA